MCRYPAELFLALLLSYIANATIGIGHFLSDSVAFGNLNAVNVSGKRQGFALSPEHLEKMELTLDAIQNGATLNADGVEVADLKELLSEMGVDETCNASLHETRMAIGRAMLTFLERRFGKRVIHLGDTSRVSGGAVYGEATVRNTSSTTLRNAHHVFHMDKYWPGLSKLLGINREEAIAATVYGHWPTIGEDLARRGLRQSDYATLASAQNPGMLNLWLSLTPGKLVQQPLALLMKDSGRETPVSKAEKVQEAVSSMHVNIKEFNDSITVLRSQVAADASAHWGFRPGMAFGEALLFPTDRTAHSAVWLPGEIDAPRVSAEIRVLVTDEPVQLKGSCDSADCSDAQFLLQTSMVTT
jgi:hypothetical protein